VKALLNCQLISKNQLSLFRPYREIDRTGKNPTGWTKNGRFLFIITLSHAFIGVQAIQDISISDKRPDIFWVRQMMRTERVEAADVAQIYQLWNEYAAAINTQNMERWGALWSENGIQMPPDAPQCSGKEQIRKLVQTQFNQSHTKLSIHPEVVCVFGNQAYSHGTFSSHVTSRGGGKKRISGKFLTVLKKQDDGSWRILVDCFNYDGAVEQENYDSNL
jgi:uncharacterized protein (TIGR02246 family)